MRAGAAAVSEVPVEIRELLADVYTPKGIEIVWKARNLSLDYTRPCDLWETRPVEVRRWAETLASGMIAT